MWKFSSSNKTKQSKHHKMPVFLWEGMREQATWTKYLMKKEKIIKHKEQQQQQKNHITGTKHLNTNGHNMGDMTVRDTY